jgi:hypothetical protein
LAGFGDDKVNARDARIRVQHRQRLLREDGAAGSGHTYGYDLSVFSGHCLRAFCAGKSSFSAGTSDVN